MLQIKALVINEANYPIAAALLPSEFLLVPEKDTYGCIVVINQPIGHAPGPISGRGSARRDRLGGGRMPYAPRRAPEGRSITFDNSWFDEETFHAEWAITEDWATDRFINVERRPMDDKNQKNIEGDGGCSCQCEAACCQH